MFDTYYIKHKKYVEQIKEDIDSAESVLSTPGQINLKSFDLHDKLNDKIWDNEKNLRHDIREDLINIASDFYDTLDIAEITEEGDPDKKPDKTFNKYIKDVFLVGSLASFNYSSYADIDLHLLMDENKLVGKNKLALNILKKYFTECKNDWNLKHSDLKIEGYDVELYVQDVKEENASNGVYSLFNDEWVKEPKPLDTANLDRAWVEKKALDYIEQIDSLEEVINSNSDLELIEKAKDELKKIKDKIVQGRRDSLATGQGEMNSYNILFKILRRSGHIGKINDLTVKAYDMLNSIQKQKESIDMKTDESIVKESEVDAIAEFEDMYGPKAGKALKAYLSKRSRKSAEEILNSDDEFDKFANWAYKHLHIDVYEKFATYDKGSFYKRTSDLARDPEQRGDRPRSDAGDDTRYSYDDGGDAGDFDSATDTWKEPTTFDVVDDDVEESVTVTEDGESHELEIKGILNTTWNDDPLDDYKYRFINRVDVDKAARFLDKALAEYSVTNDKDAFINKVHHISSICSSIEVPEDIIDDYAKRMLALVDIKVESINEADEGKEEAAKEPDDVEPAHKPRLILGDEEGKATFILTSTEPEAEANKVLSKYNELAKELYKKEHNDSEEGFTALKWTKDPEYSYWYFVAPKGIDEVKKELESEFGTTFKIEVQESKEEEKKEDEKPEQEPQPADQASQQTTTVDLVQTKETDEPKLTGTSWEDFLKNVEEQSIYKVDSAFKRHPNQWVELIDDTGKIYDGEVTQYSDGGFELLYTNIHPVPNAEESSKKTPINESYADDTIDNIKDVLKRYFEVDPETEEPNPEYDEDFTAQDALDEIVDILY